ncbi:MAG: (3R)-hydroxymyristoyl-[acyl carrier protein] dehydratase [Verrucomicrobiota bacterium]|jgi:3-hydroxymyristoyl/3-hydroxydecanoyl-(acyl carrier protein) dehydratase
MNAPQIFELADLLPVLPHREPFLFVDRVTKLVPHQSIVAERRLRADEPQFAGHFPGRPIMPGVLIAEALAQTSGLLIGLSEKLSSTTLPEKPKAFFLAVTNIKFTHPAVPGDVLVLRATSDRQFAALHRFNVEATVGRNLIATGSLTLAMVEEKI